MANPIKASDLYADDGAILEAIKQLEELQKQYKQLIEATKKEAAGLTVEVKKLNATTAEQRQGIKESAGAADEIARRFRKYSESLDENAKKIAALKNAQADINRVNKLQVKLNASLEGSYNRLSAQYSLNKIRLNQMSAEQRKATKEGQQLEKQTKEIYEEMKRLQEATGKHTLSVGDYGKALRDIPGPLGTWINGLENTRQGLMSGLSGLRGMVKGLNLFKIALASTGIGLLIIALGSLYAALQRTQKGIDFVSRIMAGLRAGVDVIIDRFIILGQSIIKLFQGDFTGAVDDAKKAFSGLGAELKEEVNTAAELTGNMQQIREETRALSVETERSRAKIKQLNLAIEDTSKSAKERTDAAREAFQLESDLLSKQEGLLSRELSTLKAQKDLGTSLAGDLDEIAAKEIELERVRQQSLEIQTTLNNKLNTIRREQAAAAKAAAEETARQQQELKALTDEIATAQAQLAGPAEVARLEYERTIEAIDRLEAKARSLGETLDFSAQRILAKAKLDRQLDAITLPLEQLPAKIKGTIEPMQAAVKESITAISETAKQATQGEGIYGLLGLDLTSDQQKGIQTSFDFAKDALMNYFQERTQISNQLVAQADRRVQAAQAQLDAELQAAQAGYAANVERARRELALAQQNQQKALAEQEKAQRRQRQIQTLEQTGNLITASAKIWAQLGFPFAIPAIGLMWGNFLASKIKASQLARQEYAEGGFEFLRGGSHASGRDIPLGITADGKDRRAEGGEALAIFNRRNTAKYGGLLPEIVNSINRGTFERQFQSINQAHGPVVVAAGTDTSRMETELSSIRRQGERRFFTDGQGRRVEVYRNVKRVYV